MIFFADFSPLACSVEDNIQQSQVEDCLTRLMVLGEQRARFKPGCPVACRFRVPCTLYLQVPCAASCLCTAYAKSMQCNVPADWRLQTAQFASAYACEPRVFFTKVFPGFPECVKSHELSATTQLQHCHAGKHADLLDDRSHVCICCCIGAYAQILRNNPYRSRSGMTTNKGT